MRALAIITVTHNSEKYLPHYFASLRENHIEYKQLLLVDSGSEDTSYLKAYEALAGVEIVYEANIGFCRANNVGYTRIKPDIEAVLFLNPDIFFAENILPQCMAHLFAREELFAVSPQLIRCEIDAADKMKLLTAIDSNGIEHTWYGKYYDAKEESPAAIRCVPALCGAFMLCKRSGLDQIQLGGQVFREAMYMYKEDIELCLRAGRYGYKTELLTALRLYHGRGWKKRQDVAAWQKIRAARNEFYLLPYAFLPAKIVHAAYYSLKYLYVKYIETRFL